MTPSQPLWTISELSERVSVALAESDLEPPANGQVRAVPDLRTIRYYTSLGLLDRPSAMRGRTALYGPRHLLQLVAIKRLQTGGQSLSQVQASLTGLDDQALARIARMSAAAARRSEASHAAGEHPPPSRREERFWAASPAPAPALASGLASGLDRAQEADAPATRLTRPTRLTRIDLAAGVSLVIEDAGRPGEPCAAFIDAAELIRAAAPLLEEMRRQGLVGEAEEDTE